ncbi:hypothetical protein ON010_g3456 [Phytophthora cinnamomi]|nr:hypothetical protein ON010_g3456 [Phytophthora cinnamomi]
MFAGVSFDQNGYPQQHPVELRDACAAPHAARSGARPVGPAVGRCRRLRAGVRPLHERRRGRHLRLPAAGGRGAGRRHGRVPSQSAAAAPWPRGRTRHAAVRCVADYSLRDRATSHDTAAAAVPRRVRQGAAVPRVDAQVLLRTQGCGAHGHYAGARELRRAGSGGRRAQAAQVLPQLLALLTKEGAEKQETAVAEAVKVELATTVAVLLEAKSPYTTPNTFALLALPSFVEEMEADESKVASSNAMFTTSAEAKSDRLETLDEEEEKPSTMAIARQQEEDCCKVLCIWLEVESRRMVAAQALAIVYRVIASGTTTEDVANGATSLTTPLNEMTKVLRGTKVTALPDFEFINALLESVRDICLFQQRLATPTLEGVFKVMRGVMSQLEAGLSLFSKKHSAERRSAKGSCSAIRHTLVEAFLAWLHHPDAAKLLTCQVDFLHNVAGTLADPRVYGDVLAVLRASTVPGANVEYDTGRRLAVVTICQAINQLARYSKLTANRIISGLTRVAAACRCDIHPLANELVVPLLPAMLDGSQWGKFLRLRTEAVATVLIGCAENNNFQTLHEPLARWPLYEEDVELVVVTLELLEALLSANTLRATVDVDAIYATILQLSENAASEGLDVISTVCKQVIASLGSQQ